MTAQDSRFKVYLSARGDFLRTPAGAIRFFDPRHDHWPDHFIFPAASGYLFIVGLTEVGRVTVSAKDSPNNKLGEQECSG